jgi:hypothetical protein
VGKARLFWREREKKERKTVEREREKSSDWHRERKSIGDRESGN